MGLAPAQFLRIDVHLEAVAAALVCSAGHCHRVAARVEADSALGRLGPAAGDALHELRELGAGHVSLARAPARGALRLLAAAQELRLNVDAQALVAGRMLLAGDKDGSSALRQAYAARGRWAQPI